MEFPCDFPLKVMGFTEGSFRSAALEIVSRHIPDFDPSRVQARQSRQGKYTSLTISFTATSRAQLDAIYEDLSASDDISVAL